MKSSLIKRYFPLLIFLFVIGSTITVVISLNQSRDDRSQATYTDDVISSSPELSPETSKKKQSAQKILDANKRIKDELYRSKANTLDLQKRLQERKQVVKEAMKTDAISVLSMQPETEKLRIQLPAELRSELETESVVKGEISTVHGDNFEEKTSINYHTLTTSDGKKIDLHFTEPSPIYSKDTSVQLEGLLLDNQMVVPYLENVKILPTSQQKNTLGVSTPYTVAVILLQFQNTSLNITKEQVRQITFTNSDSVREYFKETSFGKMLIQGHLDQNGDIFGTYTIEGNTMECNSHGWVANANAIATSDNFDVDNYDSVIYVFPNTFGCPGSGFASQEPNQNKVWINGGENYHSKIVSHEIGHNLGLGHANAYHCQPNDSPTSDPTTVSISMNCQSFGYSDPFDVMGAEYRQLNAFHKGQAHFLDSTNSQLITTNGDYIINFSGKETSSLQSLIIPTQSHKMYGSKLNYYVDFRQSFGLFDNFAQNDPILNGISVRLATDYTAPYSIESLLIDNTPQTRDNYHDSPLSVGGTFFDEVEGIKITLLKIENQQATVRVNFEEPQCFRMKPEIKIISQNTWLYPGVISNTYFSIKNRDSFACSPSSFTINSSVAGGIMIDPSTLVLNIPAGEMKNLVFNITAPLSIQRGDYTLTQSVTRSGDPSIFTQTANTRVEVTLTPTPTTSCTQRAKKADFNNDGSVNLTDYALLVREFLKNLSSYKADANCDNQVNLTDYAILVREFLK